MLGCRQVDPGFDSPQLQDILLSSKSSTQALGPTKPLSGTGDFFVGLKWPGHDKTIHLHLVPSLTMSVALSLLPQDTFAFVRLTLTCHLRLGLSNNGLVYFSFLTNRAEFLSCLVSPTSSPWRFDPIPGSGLPWRGFTITLRHITFGRTPLDEWSVRRRDLYLTTNNTHK